MIDLEELSDDDLDELFDDVRAEVNRRFVIEDAERQIAEINQKVLTAEGFAMGDPWRQPTGAHDAYPLGWEVTHEGKTWVSLRSGNPDTPGVASWREKAPEGGPPALWVQPTGAHDAYSEGDRVIWPEGGQVWISTHPGERTNTWEPGVYGWVIEADDG